MLNLTLFSAAPLEEEFLMIGLGSVPGGAGLMAMASFRRCKVVCRSISGSCAFIPQLEML